MRGGPGDRADRTRAGHFGPGVEHHRPATRCQGCQYGAAGDDPAAEPAAESLGVTAVNVRTSQVVHWC